MIQSNVVPPINSPKSIKMSLIKGIKSLIEGLAFTLTLLDSYAAGFAFFLVMIIKLLPLEPGYAILLLDAGLSHKYEFWLSLLANLPIYLGELLLGFFTSYLCKLQIRYKADSTKTIT